MVVVAVRVLSGHCDWRVQSWRHHSTMSALACLLNYGDVADADSRLVDQHYWAKRTNQSSSHPYRNVQSGHAKGLTRTSRHVLVIGVGHREASIIWLRVDDMRVDFYHLRAHLLMISMRLCWSADSVVSLSTTAWFLVASWSSWADLPLFFLGNEWFPHVYVFTSMSF